MLLLAASGLLLESFVRLQSRRTGFVADNVLTFWVRPPASRYAPERRPGDARSPARARAVGAGRRIGGREPLHAVQRLLAHDHLLPGSPGRSGDAPGVGRHYVSADYFRTLGIPLLAGRTLTAGGRRRQPAGGGRQRDGRPPLLARRERDRQTRLVRHDNRDRSPIRRTRSRSSASSATSSTKASSRPTVRTAPISTRRICSSRIPTRW